jgi:hypothetical protein
MVNSAFRSDASLPEALAARARSRSDGRLALDVVGGVCVASVLGVWRPVVWLIPFCVAICFASFGIWGITDRELRERANGPRTMLWRALSVVRVAGGVIGVLAALTGLFAGLAFALGTWIS